MRNGPAKSNDINISTMDAGEVRKMIFTTDSKLLLKKIRMKIQLRGHTLGMRKGSILTACAPISRAKFVRKT